MRFLPGVVLLVLFVCCKNTNPNKDIDAYLEKEILNRIKILDGRSKMLDSLQISTIKINKEVNDVVLLSKDIENLHVSVERANMYFKTSAEKLGTKSEDFTLLSTRMHINEMATILKQNELTLLNQLIFKTGASDISPNTAQ